MPNTSEITYTTSPSVFGQPARTTFHYAGKSYASRAAAEAAKKAAESYVVPSQTVNPETGLRQDGTPAQTSVTEPGTTVRDHTTGQTYVAGGPDDPAVKAANTPPPAPPDTTTPKIEQQQGTVDDAINDLKTRTSIEAPGATQIRTTTGPAPATTNYTENLTPTTVAKPTAVGLTPTKVGTVAGGGGGISVPSISLARPDKIDPYLAERSQAGARQYSLADLLQGIATGDADSPEAQKVRHEAALQEAAQMSIASSASPAARAAALRTALQNTGRIQGAAAAEVSSRNQQYRDSARSQLIDLLSQARAGDISEAQFDAAAINTARNLYAQLTSNTSIAEGQIKGQLGAASIGAQATLGAASLSAQTALLLKQADIDQGVKDKLFDADQKGRELDAQYAQEIKIHGADSALAIALADAKNKNDADIARFHEEAETSRTQGSLDQQAGQYASDLALRTRTQEDQQLLSLIGQSTELLQLLQGGQLAREQLSAQQLMQVQQLASAWDIANLNSATQIKLGKMSEPGFWDRFTAIAGPLLGVAAAAVGKPGKP